MDPRLHTMVVVDGWHIIFTFDDNFKSVNKYVKMHTLPWFTVKLKVYIYWNL